MSPVKSNRRNGVMTMRKKLNLTEGNRCVQQFGFGCRKTTVFKLICNPVARLDAKIICFNYMGGIGNTYGKSASCLDILHCLVRFRQIKRHAASLLHSSPGGIHKFKNSGLTASKAELVDAPVINEFPICLECEFIEYQNNEYGCGVIGKVVNVTLSPA